MHLYTIKAAQVRAVHQCGKLSDVVLETWEKGFGACGGHFAQIGGHYSLNAGIELIKKTTDYINEVVGFQRALHKAVAALHYQL